MMNRITGRCVERINGVAVIFFFLLAIVLPMQNIGAQGSKVITSNDINMDIDNLVRGCRLGRRILVERALEAVDVDIKDHRGFSCIHWAAMGGHSDIIEMLLQRGARIDILNKKGSTPLILASWKGRVETVKLLLNNGASPNVANRGKMTPLKWGVALGRADIVDILVEAGAEVTNADVKQSKETKPTNARILNLLKNRVPPSEL